MHDCLCSDRSQHFWHLSYLNALDMSTDSLDRAHQARIDLPQGRELRRAGGRQEGGRARLPAAEPGERLSVRRKPGIPALVHAAPSVRSHGILQYAVAASMPEAAAYVSDLQGLTKYDSQNTLRGHICPCSRSLVPRIFPMHAWASIKQIIKASPQDRRLHTPLHAGAGDRG